MKTPEKIYLKDYQPTDFLIDHVDLIFDIHEDFTRVTANMKMRRRDASAVHPIPLCLDMAESMEIESVVADTMVLLPEEYVIDDGTLTLAKTPDIFELEIIGRLYPHQNTSLEGLYQSGEVLCTQCEAQGFRKITPFLDRPDVMSTYSCTIVADRTRYPVLLSNGNSVREGKLEGNRHFARWEDPFKKPCYLFALVAGDLEHIHDQFTTCSGRVIDLKIYSEKENISQCHHAMASLKQAMKWDEERFGLEYDLDLYQIVAINDFNAGAMENKGLNIFNSKYVIADARTATDDDFMNIQSVIAHEYFHNWTGNRVTLRNWFQLSLKEGLTVFRDQEFSSDLNSREVKRVASVRNLRAFQFPEDAGPMTHPVMPDAYIKMDNFYTMTVYEKGAEVIRMLHTLLGEDTFQKAMAAYFKKYDGMAVTIEDFVSVIEEASRRDLSQFRLWYTQSGTPTVTMQRHYSTETGKLEVTLTQETLPDRNQEQKHPFHIPVGFGLICRDSASDSLQAPALLELKEKQQTFSFENVPPGTLPSIFRRFSAPVKIETDLTTEELACLMADDTDGFNRWDAAQTLFLQEIRQLVTAIESDRTHLVSDTLLDAFQKALTNGKTDRAFTAKMLTLPLETEIKDHFSRINVAAVHDARKTLETTLAQKLEPDFMDIVQRVKPDPSSLSHEAMADRSFRSLALGYLGSLKTEKVISMVKDLYESAGNMTDELAAFKILSEISPAAKASAAEQFYSKWQHDKLVLDKWFMVQAGSSLDDTLETVVKLTSHPDFSFKNPNKVRSLIYILAIHNPMNFHREDGSGYEFIADQVIRLDKINPQIAARLSGCFNHWKKYDTVRQAGMSDQINRILAIPDLSRNVFEILSRAVS